MNGAFELLGLVVVSVVILLVLFSKYRFTRHDGFYTKLIGVAHHQTSVKNCLPGEPLQLVREKDSAMGSHTIAVRRRNGKGLGFLLPRLAKRLAPDMDVGIEFRATVANITGGTSGKPTRGVNIHIVRAK